MSILKSEYDKNVYLNYFFRIIGALLSFVSARFILKYLGSNLYGLWITISSVVSWLGNGDLGIGNGLRNALSKAYGEKNKLEQEMLIGVAFNLLTKVSAFLFLLMVLLCEFLILLGILPLECQIPFIITTAFFCINLALGVSQSIVFSYQKSWLSAFSLCFNNLSILLFIFLVNRLSFFDNLITFSIINGISSLIPNIILILILRKNSIRFSFKMIDRTAKSVKKVIVNTGVAFFGLQLSCIVLYSTDSLIIENIFGEEMVTKYSLISKVYDSGISFFGIALISFWSAVTYKIAQNEYIWIKERIKKLLGFWMLFTVGVIIVSFNLNPLMKLWIGDGVPEYDSRLIILFGIYCCIHTLSSVFVYMINGTGKIKLQLVLLGIGAIVNIPLSVFLGQYCEMGLFGIKLATLICLLATDIAMPIQAMRLLKKWQTI